MKNEHKKVKAPRIGKKINFEWNFRENTNENRLRFCEKSYVQYM
jgi:hypothetical protein